MLGLRYHAFVEGHTLPQLTAALTTSIGEVLYCEYVSSVVRMPARLLCLGNDPLVFMDEAPAVGFGRTPRSRPGAAVCRSRSGAVSRTSSALRST
jgi:hypothetical protein